MTRQLPGDLVLELDKDAPKPYKLKPLRVASFEGRDDIVVCLCEPPLWLDARCAWGEDISTGLVGVASRVASGATLDRAELHPVNVIVIRGEADATLTKRDAVFAYLGFVRAA